MTDERDNRDTASIAAAWVARLDRGGLSPDELIALREWAIAHPSHLRELERAARIWESLDPLAALRHIVARPARARRKRAVPYAVAASIVAVAIAISIGLLHGTRAGIEAPEYNASFVTRIGEMHVIEPGEGSRISLNTDSRLAVEFDSAVRAVRLDRGEAYFDVDADDNRPFVVETDFGDVVVTGTAFLVRVEEAGLEVAVREGRVQLQNASADPGEGRTPVAMLSAGEVASVESDGSRRIEPIESERLVRKLGWRDGMLMFNGESLEEVVREVGRYTPIEINIEDQTLRTRRIGGYFRAGEIDDLLATLESDFGIRVERIGDSEVNLSLQN